MGANDPSITSDIIHDYRQDTARTEKAKLAVNCLECGKNNGKIQQIPKTKLLEPEEGIRIFDLSVVCERITAFKAKKNKWSSSYVNYNCPNGNAAHRIARCKNCKHAGEVKPVKMLTTKPGVFNHEIMTYQCLLSKNGKDYYRPYCYCDQFEPKEGIEYGEQE